MAGAGWRENTSTLQLLAPFNPQGPGPFISVDWTKGLISYHPEIKSNINDIQANPEARITYLHKISYAYMKGP